MPEALAPAYYAPPSKGWRRDVLALLHPPYTAWHLSYAVIGASLAPHVDFLRLAATLVAFFFAVRISTHALDELHGRPLRTSLPSSALVWAAEPQHAGATPKATEQRGCGPGDAHRRNADRPRPASPAQATGAGAARFLVGGAGAGDRAGPFASSLDRRHPVLAEWSR